MLYSKVQAGGLATHLDGEIILSMPEEFVLFYPFIYLFTITHILSFRKVYEYETCTGCVGLHPIPHVKESSF